MSYTRFYIRSVVQTDDGDIESCDENTPDSFWGLYGVTEVTGMSEWLFDFEGEHQKEKAQWAQEVLQIMYDKYGLQPEDINFDKGLVHTSYDELSPSEMCDHYASKYDLKPITKPTPSKTAVSRVEKARQAYQFQLDQLQKAKEELIEALLEEAHNTPIVAGMVLETTSAAEGVDCRAQVTGKFVVGYNSHAALLDADAPVTVELVKLTKQGTPHKTAGSWYRPLSVLLDVYREGRMTYPEGFQGTQYIPREKVMEYWEAGESVCVEYDEVIHGVLEVIDFYITEDSGRTKNDVQRFIDDENCYFFLD
jgi:hypothetical protein